MIDKHQLTEEDVKHRYIMLGVTNLFLHGVDEPNLRHMDLLGSRLRDWKADCDVIGMNPPFGGATDASVRANFPTEFQTSETADLFMALIMQRLKRGGRAGVIIPDGFKHFSKTKPMTLAHCEPIIAWWNNRAEIVNDEVGEKARCFTVRELLDDNCNFDQCKYPKEDEEILPPKELIARYREERARADAEIGQALDAILEKIGEQR